MPTAGIGDVGAVRGRPGVPGRRRGRPADRRGRAAARHGDGRAAPGRHWTRRGRPRSASSTPRPTRWRCWPRSASRRRPAGRGRRAGLAASRAARARCSSGPRPRSAFSANCIREVLDAMGATGPMAVFEIMLDALPAPKAKPTKARAKLDLPDLMPVERDFAFVVEERVPAADILQGRAGGRPGADHRADVFDVYAARACPRAASRSRSAVTLQPRERTMTDAGPRGDQRQDRGRGRQEDRRRAAPLSERSEAGNGRRGVGGQQARGARIVRDLDLPSGTARSRCLHVEAKRARMVEGAGVDPKASDGPGPGPGDAPATTATARALRPVKAGIRPKKASSQTSVPAGNRVPPGPQSTPGRSTGL